jgi:hypothetical protein
MYETFLHFQESAQKFGLLQANPELSRQFEVFAEKFTDLKKEANEAMLEGSENEDDRLQQNTPPEQSIPADRISQGPSLQTVTPPEVEHLDLGWGYAATTEVTQDPSSQDQRTHSDDFLSHLPSSSCHSQTLTNETNNARQHHTPAERTLDGGMPTRTQYRHHHHHQQQQQQQQQQPLPFGLVAPGREHSPQFSFAVSTNIPTPDLSPPTTGVCTPPTCALPNMVASRGLPSITTYSFEETSFARRLTRATTEAAYHLLCQPSSRRRSLDSVFRLSLPFTTLDDLIKKFKWMVSRDINEDFDWWDTPFIHLGGAGTHYPRRDPQGNAIPLKNSWTVNSWTVRQTGPFERHMMRLESVADGRWQDIGGIDFRDFEGEWFDAHDVQGYLEDRWACKIDMRSSFAQCLVSEEDLAPLQMSEHESVSPNFSHSPISAAGPAQGSGALHDFAPCYGLDASSFHHSPVSGGPRATDLSRSEILELPFDQALGLDLAPGSSLGFSGTTGFNLGLNLELGSIGPTEGATIVRRRRNKTAWVDVTKLIRGKSAHRNSSEAGLIVNTGLIQHTCCLGRASGYRRENIDLALRGALVAPY